MLPFSPANWISANLVSGRSKASTLPEASSCWVRKSVLRQSPTPAEPSRLCSQEAGLGFGLFGGGLFLCF